MEVADEEGKVERVKCIPAEGVVRLLTCWLAKSKKPVAQFRSEAAPELVRSMGGGDELLARLSEGALSI